MIVSFSLTIFDEQDCTIQECLADILVLLLDDKHLIDMQSISLIFFNEENYYIFSDHPIAQEYMSKRNRELLKNYIQNYRQQITRLLKNYLSSMTIGMNYELGEITPQDAYRIIKHESQIVLENEITDWKFIKCICEKYANARRLKRNSVYQLINKSLTNELLIPHHSGGIGEIPKIVDSIKDSQKYKNVYKYKIMALFDSDKPGDQKNSPSNIIALLKYFKQKEINDQTIQSSDYEYDPGSDLIIWHMLYKRKIENYVPLDVLFYNLTSVDDTKKKQLKDISPSELDYLQYDQHNVGIGKSKIKQQFPDFFLKHFSYEELEKRCEHHKIQDVISGERISEIEQILLKIARIV
ncbi:hypothetical protein VB712_04620 [Spirulina sp. CCNP1310]|uniref:hypothetical protein n=1 Tax=Spirulina sp. CCNP1310 TaxID=3110249 RepID=UPI002B214FD7|nr:hypothetical protein [Spirulina sp. CCNP1310]MEA5418499.1 hypothetical protein [Spirulina sp. CCNP1310]